MTDDEALERLATETALTVEESADLVGVSQVAIRQWEKRGQIERVPGFTEVRFFAGDLWRCQMARKPRRYVARVAVSAAAFRAVQ